MLDFTSALYLGLQHPSWSLPSWQALTLGKPAALAEPPGIGNIERELAALTGCDAALLASSTLHAFVDLFAMLARSGTAIVLNRHSYPIAHWAARQAAVSGSAVIVVAGHGVEDMRQAVCRRPAASPVIVIDGVSPTTGTAAPIAAYVDLAAEFGGLLVVDDTQGLGILGESASRSAPYGIGGGGLLRHAEIRSDRVIVVNSLAKAFGVPVAMVGGSRPLIDTLRQNSLMRVHCSPPSMAVIAAAAQALHLNRRDGEALRARLAHNVARLRAGLTTLGVAASWTLFPVQPLHLADGMAATVQSRLLHRGVRAVLHGRSPSCARMSFLLTARHAPTDIDAAIEHLARATESAAQSITGVSGYGNQSQFRGGIVRRLSWPT
jgi:8-amino-7-oxononanoate synthase